jgi:hypothetical protein
VNSRNGVKVNGVRVTEKRLDPGDVLSLATHRYEVKYSPVDLGAVGPPPPEIPESDIFNKSLLERAGLSHQRLPKTEIEQHNADRFDITKDEPGRLHIRQPTPEEPV